MTTLRRRMRTTIAADARTAPAPVAGGLRRVGTPGGSGTGDRATTDLLTASAFERRLAEEVRRARMGGMPLTVAVLTLDGVADDLTGEAVLQGVIARLRGFAEPWEALGRVAGGRVGWILPGVDADRTVRMLEGVRSEFADAPPHPAPATVSAGVCSLTHGVDRPALVRHALDALTALRRTGRDGIAVHSPEPARPAAPVRSSTGAAAREALSRALEARHPQTRHHCSRVAALADRIAAGLGWSAARRRRLMEAADLHDVGKLVLPDGLLSSPGPLAPGDRAMVNRHPQHAAELLDGLLDAEQIRWVRHHHERWDGGGYPDGLAGRAIGAGARIIAVADAVDAMTTPRPYRTPVTMDEAVAECAACSGTQFDPEVVDALRRTLGGHQDPVENRGGDSAG